MNEFDKEEHTIVSMVAIVSQLKNIRVELHQP